MRNVPATLVRRGNGAGLTSSSRLPSPRKRVENNLLDRTTRWPSASKLATVHHVAGQPGPVGLKHMILDFHSHSDISQNCSVNYVAMPTTLRQWKGEQALGLDNSGNLVARVAGGAQSTFPRIPLLQFIRGPSWEAAFQVRSEGVWTNFVYATGRNVGPYGCNLWDRHGSSIAQVVLGIPSASILQKGKEIGHIVHHVIPFRLEVFAGAAQPICVLEMIPKAAWLSSERGIAYWLSVKEQEPSHPIDVRIMVAVMLFPWMCNGDVTGHNEVIWENQERPTMKLTRT